MTEPTPDPRDSPLEYLPADAVLWPSQTPTPAEVRAEGRRLLAEWHDALDALNATESDPQAADWVEDSDAALGEFFYRHATVLLADPAPLTLTDPVQP